MSGPPDSRGRFTFPGRAGSFTGREAVIELRLRLIKALLVPLGIVIVSAARAVEQIVADLDLVLVTSLAVFDAVRRGYGR